jgi:hypothetical protein
MRLFDKRGVGWKKLCSSAERTQMAARCGVLILLGNRDLGRKFVSKPWVRFQSRAGSVSAVEGARFGAGGLLDAFAAGVAGIDVVPELDVVLVEFPAEEHLAAVADVGEIDQPAIEVFDLHAHVLNPAKLSAEL